MYISKYAADRKLEELQEELRDLNLDIDKPQRRFERFNIWRSTVRTILELALPESKSYLATLESRCDKYAELQARCSKETREQMDELVAEVVGLLSSTRDTLKIRRDDNEDAEFQTAVTAAVNKIYFKKWWSKAPAAAFLFAAILAFLGVFKIGSYQLSIEEEAKKALDTAVAEIRAKTTSINAKLGDLSKQTEKAIEDQKLEFKDEMKGHVDSTKKDISDAAQASITKDIPLHINAENIRITDATSDMIQKDLDAHKDMEKLRITREADTIITKDLTAHLSSEKRRISDSVTSFIEKDLIPHVNSERQAIIRIVNEYLQKQDSAMIQHPPVMKEQE